MVSQSSNGRRSDKLSLNLRWLNSVETLIGGQSKIKTKDLADVEALHRESIIIDGHCNALGPVIRGQKRLGERAVEKRLRDSDPLPGIPPPLKPGGSIRGVEGAAHRRLEDRSPWEKFIGHFDFPRAREGSLPNSWRPAVT